MDADRTLYDRAAARFGLVTRGEARSDGVSEDAMWRRQGRGEWVAAQAGVYRARAAPSSWEQALVAAVLAAGEPSAISHRAAAILWGIGGVSGTIRELTVPYAHRPVPAGVVVHRSLDLDARWITTRHGVPVTTVARTLVDLGAVASLGVVDRAVTDALGTKLVTMPELRGALDALGRRGRRGAGVLRRSLDRRGDAEPAGISEARLGRVLARARIPPIEPEYEVRDDEGRFVARVDYAVPLIALALEVNGYEWHSAYERFQADHVRRNALHLAGWDLIEFTPLQVVRDPHYVIRTVEEACRLRIL